MALKFLNNGYFAGKVGIGTESPSYKFTAYGSSVDSEIVASFGSANDQNEYTAIGLSGFIASNGATKAGLALKRTSTYGTGELHFLNNNTTDNSDMTLSDSKMMINSSGNVGIGTTSPVGKLYVGPTWSTAQNGNFLYIKDQGSQTNYSPKITNTTNLGITYVGSSTTTGGPDIAGLTLYNNSGVAGQFSPMILFAGLESGTSQFKATMAAIYARSPLGTGDGGSWIDGELIFATAGAATTGVVQRMVINKEGNVGIGTTSPSQKLHVAGNLRVTGAYYDSNNSPGTANQVLVSTVTGTDWIDGSAIPGVPGGSGTTNYLAKWTPDGDTLGIGLVYDNGTNVGIGTTNPASKFVVADGMSGVNNQTALEFIPQHSNNRNIIFSYDRSSGAYKELNFDAANFKFNPGGSSKMVILSNGNVGIGTTSPDAQLELYKASNTSTIRLSASATDTTYYSDISNNYNSGNTFQITTGGGNVIKASESAYNSITIGGFNNIITLYPNSGYTNITGNLTVVGNIITGAALLSNQENTDVDTGTETVASVAIATYTAAFFDFVIKKTTNVRSGTVYACHDGTNVEFTETSTQDLGDTSDVTLSVDISGGSMRLRATTTSDDWSVKSLIRAI